MIKGLTTLFVFSLAATAAAQQAVKVTTGTLNVRSGPGTTYGVVGETHSGEIYVRISTSGSWSKIWFNDQARWVSSSYVTAVTATVKAVNTGTLNVRSGPGSSYGIVGTAPLGSQWAVVATSGSWSKVYYGGAARWMYSTYLGASAPTLPTSSVGFVQLPASGTGFYGYTAAGNRWGLPSLVYPFMDAAADWATVHPTWPAIGVGDISLQNGGPMPGHASHQVGKDVDLRPVRVDTVGPTTIFMSNYSSSRSKDWITDHVKPKLDVKVIFFNDPLIEGPLSYVQPWPNHDNHMHVRIY